MPARGRVHHDAVGGTGTHAPNAEHSTLVNNVENYQPGEFRRRERPWSSLF
jgi:hypothetical protein